MILSWLMCPMWAATGPTPRHDLIPSVRESPRVHVPLWLIYRGFFVLFFRRKMHLRSALKSTLLIKHLKASSSEPTKGIWLETGKEKYTHTHF